MLDNAIVCTPHSAGQDRRLSGAELPKVLQNVDVCTRCYAQERIVDASKVVQQLCQIPCIERGRHRVQPAGIW